MNNAVPTFYNRQSIEREIESIENPHGMRLNDAKERPVLPGGTLRRVLAVIDGQAERIAVLEAKLVEWNKKAATWIASPESAKRLEGYRELTARINDLEAKELALHGQLAESMLNASTGWARWEMANRLSNSLQAQLASGQDPDMPAICAALGFDPTNHHNAAKYPYCRPVAPSQQPLSDEQALVQPVKVITLADFFEEAKRIGLTADVFSAQLASRPEFADCLAEAHHGIKEKP